VNKKYFFGYVFARGAKLFALLAIAAGVGFCVLQYNQAEIATAAAAYQPSLNLQQTLRKLQESFAATQEIVDSFDRNNQTTTPAMEPPKFPAVIESNDDFDNISEELIRVDQDVQRLKQSVVERFEGSVTSIEQKLRNYAANLDTARPATAPATSPVPDAAAIVAAPRQSQTTLFSPIVGPDEIKQRSANLTQRKEFLKSLESKAENAENRAILNEAANQMDQLSKLLPDKIETPRATDLNAPPKQTPDEEGRKPLLSERVASQLAQLRNEVRESLLTAWKLDDAFDQATELVAVEREKCRVATLAQKGIWLSAGSKMLPGVFAALLLAFMILVFADLVRTLLDTAAHTGTVADAVNALRGSTLMTKNPLSATPAPAPAPPPATTPSARDFEIADRKLESIQAEIPVAGGS
jgi:hypothetical protein